MSDQTDVPARAVPPDFTLLKELGGFNDVVAPCYVRFGEKDIAFGFLVEPHHCNPMGSCHGGMLMTFVDIMFAGIVCHRIGKFVGTPTMNISCDFLSAPKIGDWLQSELHFIHLTHSVAFVGGAIVGPAGIAVRANGAFKLPK